MHLATSHPRDGQHASISVRVCHIYFASLGSNSELCFIQEELGAQMLVFYTCKALLNVETRYPRSRN